MLRWKKKKSDFADDFIVLQIIEQLLLLTFFDNFHFWTPIFTKKWAKKFCQLGFPQSPLNFL